MPLSRREFLFIGSMGFLGAACTPENLARAILNIPTQTPRPADTPALSPTPDILAQLRLWDQNNRVVLETTQEGETRSLEYPLIVKFRPSTNILPGEVRDFISQFSPDQISEFALVEIGALDEDGNTFSLGRVFDPGCIAGSQIPLNKVIVRFGPDYFIPAGVSRPYSEIQVEKTGVGFFIHSVTLPEGTRFDCDF